MLEALGATEAGFVVACTPDVAPGHPGARGGRRGRAARASSAEAVSDVASTRCTGRSASPADDDLVLVTGSLYVVGPAARRTC